MKSVILIPCRLESNRFPNKPLAKILNKPMIQWVYEAAEKSDATDVFVITDSKEIIQNSALTWFSGLIIHLSFWYSISFIISQSASDFQVYNIEGRYLLVLIISLSALMDTLAYFGGRRFGKRKFLKNISPNKTLEGFLISIGTVPIIFTILFSFITNLPTSSLFIIFLI